MLNIIVCIKQVQDPEAPTSSYKVDSETNRVVQKGVPPVISPFDENALEAALRIKDGQEARITALSMGKSLSKAVLSRSLAAGCDELILLDDKLFDNLDSYATAPILAAAIKEIEDYDVILTGIQSADWNAGIVGSGIASILDIPCLTNVRKIENKGNYMRAERLIDSGYQVVETGTPSVFTICNELGKLRSIALKDMMAAQKKPLKVWTTSDLEIEEEQIKRAKLLSLYIPQIESRCEMVNGETESSAGVNLARKLREACII